uniref:AAA+ ATPase domain-containing protein n=1 Tax=Oryza glumipatula TaxID=40148 RepID=A0A0E0ARH0_9ORYZ
MATMLVGVSTGVMNTLLSKLSKILEDKYTKLKGVRRQIAFFRNELSSMKAALEMLETVEELDPLQKEWRDTVRELAYDIEDCIDPFLVLVDQKQDEQSTFFKGFSYKLKKMKARHEISNEIEELKTRVIEASKRHKRYNFVGLQSSHGTSGIDPRLRALYVEVDELVGIKGPKEHVMEWFAKGRGDVEVKVLSVVGSGGLGKTTLANQIFRQLKCQFECTGFVSVSRSPDIKSILRQMHTEVGITDDTSEDERQLIDKIRDHLKDKRYFVVIDDVWDVEAWEAVKLALFNNRCGSRIVMTTRNAAVASHCSRGGGCVYQMEPLSFVDSKMLFCQRAFRSQELYYPHLEEVCDEILAKCGGLPLAIITVSSLLAGKHAKDEWDRMLTAIGHALAKNPDAANMTKILSLSYFDLPHHLRTCFLYLSVFPEDYKISKQHLINRWIAEGFVHEEQGWRTYEVGGNYFNDLINRSLIQPVDINDGQAKACQVHDIILDFITCKAAEENFVTSVNSVEHGNISECRVRRLCVKNHNNEKVSKPTSLNVTHVRSLTMFGHVDGISLFAFPILRVLDLSYSLLKDKHLKNIEKLHFLKYLSLRSTLITKLPRKIGQLNCLETLDISYTEILELPLSIAKLECLANLYVGRGTRFPDRLIGKMHSLVELEEFGVSCELGKSLQGFSQLSKLRTLKVHLFWWSDAEGCQNYVSALLSSNLHHLYLTGGPLIMEKWYPPSPCIIRKLHIIGCYIRKVPNWMSSLGSLTELQLWIHRMGPNDIEILGAIPSLCFLKLKTMCGINGRIIICSNKGFRSLTYFSLRIKRCGTLLEFEPESMPKLDNFQVEFRLHGMDCLNGASDFGIQHLSALTKVKIGIWGNICSDGIYDPEQDMNNSITRSVVSLIKAAIEKLPNHPTSRFHLEYDHGSCLLGETSQEFEGQGPDEAYPRQHKIFSLRELEDATNCFSNSNVLQRGRFDGSMYKGRLGDGSLVVVKKDYISRALSMGYPNIDWRTRHFQTQVEMPVHRNLMRLHGFCITPTKRTAAI